MADVATRVNQPTTVIGFLRKIEEILQQPISIYGLREEFSELSRGLIRICQEDLIKIKEEFFLRQGREWSGLHVLTGGFPREQDGYQWSNRETIEIREDGIRCVATGISGIYQCTEQEVSEWEMSEDGRFVKRVFHRVTKKFGFGEEAEEIVILEETLELQENTIVKVEITRNFGELRRETETPYRRTVHHELILPIELPKPLV